MAANSSTSSFKMRQQIPYMLVFLLTVFCLDRGIGALLREIHHRCNRGTIGHTNEVFHTIQPEILVIGSSRASHHYVSELIEQQLSESCFNAGADGTEIEYHAAVYFNNVERYTPRILILDINEFRFTIQGGNQGKLKMLAPYLGNNQRLKEIFFESDPWARIKILSAIYPYNSDLADLLAGGGITTLVKGYSALHGVMDNSGAPEIDSRMQDIKPDEKKLAILESVLRDACQRGIQVVLVQSPRYIISDDNSIVQCIQALANQYGAAFFNDINHPLIFDQAQYFKDPAHLNHEGAMAYTRVIIRYLNALPRLSHP